VDDTVLIVDGDGPARTRLLEALRRLGVRALGVAAAVDAAALLGSLDADLTLVRGEEDEAALAPLMGHGRLLRVSATEPLEEAVVQVLRALGRPEEAALVN
jgi:hypothetical protein